MEKKIVTKIEMSIIIINYNDNVLTKQAVDSIFAIYHSTKLEIIVVENGNDPTQKFDCADDRVVILRGIDNNGFGNACNIGACKAQGKFILFLNNDTIMHESTIDACTSYMSKHPNIGAMGARTLLANGTLDHACKRGFPAPMASLYYFAGMDKRHPDNSKYGVYRQTFVKEDSISEVDSVSGSFLMMPAELFKQLGGFDEQFFMYGEDVDLCYRVKEAGFKVVYYGEASLTHLKGQSGLHRQSEEVLGHFYRAMAIFYKKHYTKKYNFVISTLVLTAIKAKWLLSVLKLRTKNIFTVETG